VEFVVARQDQQRDLTRPDEVAVHAEDELTAEHPLAELAQRGVVEIGLTRSEAVGPPVEHAHERTTVPRAQPDGILQDGSAHPAGRTTSQAQAVRRADASPHDVDPVESEVVDQGDVVIGKGLPPVPRAHRGTGRTGVALVHRDDGERVGQLLDGIDPRHRLAGGVGSLPPQLGH
jgi:hypothetical protein